MQNNYILLAAFYKLKSEIKHTELREKCSWIKTTTHFDIHEIEQLWEKILTALHYSTPKKRKHWLLNAGSKLVKMLFRIFWMKKLNFSTLKFQD